MQTHAERFRRMMAEWNLTQEELGQLCGLKRGTIGTIVNGKTVPDVEALARLKQAMPQLKWDWLLLGKGDMAEKSYGSEPTTQLPPPVPSEAKPAREGFPATPGTATPKEADFVGRLIAQLEAENARKDTLIEWLQDQNAALLKKPLASADAAAFLGPAPSEISLRPTACQPTPRGEAKVIRMWAEVEPVREAA